MSGVDNICFLNILPDCTGKCRKRDGMSCPSCYKAAKPHEWEPAKQAYNRACKIEAGDQLICDKEGCWQYVRKGRTDTMCRLCSGAGKAAMQERDGNQDEQQQSRSRSRSRIYGSPPRLRPASSSPPSASRPRATPDELASLVIAEVDQLGKVLKRMQNRWTLVDTTRRHIADDLMEAKDKLQHLKRDLAAWRAT